jgi:hypothetical protein
MNRVQGCFDDNDAGDVSAGPLFQGMRHDPSAWPVPHILYIPVLRLESTEHTQIYGDICQPGTTGKDPLVNQR